MVDDYHVRRYHFFQEEWQRELTGLDCGTEEGLRIHFCLPVASPDKAITYHRKWEIPSLPKEYNTPQFPKGD